MNPTAIELLDAVDRVIRSHGPAGVTLRRVGTEAGLSHTAAAHYYKNKPGLFTAYLTRAWNQVAIGVEQASQISTDRDALLACGESYAQFAIDNPSAFSVLGRLELANIDAPELWEARERGFFCLTQLVVRAQTNGWAPNGNTLDIVATTWSFVHGFVDLWVGGPLAAPYDGQDLIPTMRSNLEGLLDGLDQRYA